MATKAPKVDTLAKSMAALDPGYREQRNLINEQIAGLSGLYGAQREALDATKVQSFNQINDQATGRGAAFSGIPVHEQADYLSTHYLPGLTNLANQENAERMQYRQDMARLNTEQRNMAIGRIDQQQSALNQWNLQQAQLQAQARENALNRQFEAAQNAADRAAQAASRASSAPPTIQQYISDALASNYNGENVRNGWTEDVLARQVASLYGISRQEALNRYIYPARRGIE